MRGLTPKEVDELEMLVDRTSIVRVLEALGDICSDKAEHVSGNYGDRALARRWDKASAVCGRAAIATGKIGGVD